MKQQPVHVSHTRSWKCVTKHAQVLLAIAHDPDARVTEIAGALGITERYAYRVLSDLQRAGYVRRSRHGRCNRYEVNSELRLGDPVLEEQSLHDLLQLARSGDPLEEPDVRRPLRPMEIEKQPPVDLSTLRSWTFLTHHAQLLLAMARNPETTVGELAEALRVTERSVYRILADLQKEGYVERRKVGRNNRYELNPAARLRDVDGDDRLVRDLIQLIRGPI
jgi:DNA-binding MarR family transcriptional regulator